MADSAGFFELASNIGDFFSNSSNDDLLIRTQYPTQDILIGPSNGVSTIVITSNQVGILKSAPTYTLDVRGDINFTGTLYSNGQVFTSGGGGASGFSFNGSNLFTNCNIGIGNSAPTVPLQVTNDTNATITVGTSGGTLGRLMFGNANHGIGRGINLSTATDVNDIIMHTAGAGSAVFCTNNTEQMRVLNTGSVGIGTTSPAYKLDVVGKIRATNNIVVNNGSNYSFLRSNGVETPFAYIDNANVVRVYSASNGASFLLNPDNNSALEVNYNNNTATRIYCGLGVALGTSLCNVGIGTSTPSYRLDINGTARVSNGDVRITNTTYSLGYSNSILFEHNNGSSVGIGRIYSILPGNNMVDIRLASSSNNIQTDVLCLNNGNAGIGTTTPAYKLDVNGSTRTSGTLTVSQSTANTIAVPITTGSTGVALHVVNSALSNGVTQQHIALSAGKSLTTNNVANFRYMHSNDGSACNYVGIGFWANDDILNVQASGNVGIGTTTPAYKLEVAGETRIRGTTTSPVFTTFGNSDYSSFVSIFTGGTGDVPATIWKSGSPMRFGTWTSVNGTWSELARIDASGNFGIGTASPSYKLDVNGNARINNAILGNIINNNLFAGFAHSNNTSGTNYALLQQNTGATFINSATGQSIIFRHNNVDQMALSNGNLGIGTTTPAYKLDVNGVLRILPNNDPSTTNIYLDSSGQTNGKNWGILSTHNAAGEGAGKLLFKQLTNSVNALILDSNGNIGIGTNSPTYKLDVVGKTRTTNVLSVGDGGDGYQTTTQWTGIVCNNSAYGAGSNIAIQFGKASTLMDSWFLCHYHIGNSSTNNRLEIAPYGQNNTFVILAGGNVGINTSSPSQRLHVVGNILASGDITAFSDKRLKSNINIIPNALSKVHKISGYTFDVDIQSSNDTTNAELKVTPQHTGLIAQEVLEVLPEAVHKDKEGYYSLAYGNIVGLLVQAVKELDEKYEKALQTINKLQETHQKEISELKVYLSNLV